MIISKPKYFFERPESDKKMYLNEFKKLKNF